MLGPDAEIVATLRALASADDAALDGLMGSERENLEESGLTPAAHALVRFTALVALGASREAFTSEIRRAFERGVRPAELLGAIVAAAPQVGAPRSSWASRELLAAIHPSTATPDPG